MSVRAEEGALRQEPRHPIQVVARRTGLSADVIRVWERRYGVVTPKRRGGGRRFYSDEDIQRLSLLQRVTSAGRRISEVAGLENSALKKLVEEDGRSDSTFLLGSAAARGVDAHVKHALQAIREMNSGRLHRTLAAASTELPLSLFLDQVIGVLLTRVGDAWEQGSLRVSHEHMASVVIRRFLAGMLGRERSNGPLIVLTTLAGQSHEMGALLAAITAESEGWRALYLGPDLPAAEIAAAAIQIGADAVGLSLQSRGDEAVLAEELQQLRMALPESVPLIVGGKATPSYQSLLTNVGAFIPQDLAAFREILASL